MNVLCEMFAFDEAMKINTILLSSCGLHDVMVWNLNKNGVYTVKSAYRWLYDIEHQDQRSATRWSQMP